MPHPGDRRGFAGAEAPDGADFLTWPHYGLLGGTQITESYFAAWNNAMNSEGGDNAFVVDFNELPSMFPTHRHHPVFWEKLGRAVATFGFLEELLGKAIFAFTGTTPYNENEIQAAFERWLPTLENALIDPWEVYLTHMAKPSEATQQRPSRILIGYWMSFERLRQSGMFCVTVRGGRQTIAEDRFPCL